MGDTQRSQQATIMLQSEPGELRKYSYEVNLHRMMQMNLTSGRERRIRRLPAGRPPDLLDAFTKHVNR